ncbi:glycoside hydrolase family 5 protein [Aaosphaeria arxii CBS 175.79]|uniref:cellulase n=1 Tax=Aaosphaeria arxii CBS 175.79 TaxID=1450172 RepID=A0A6A5Y0F2_9PLEO|nr:glycoside hydrolase family 5 protein [Aaosphaeria arxii CBS 175.79]KAF2018034.1 glycoside hydrolase family 5 protein [Aaosphaeria arxii CBS 175.79]
MLFQNLLAALAVAGAVTAAPSAKRQERKLKWFGINESGAEFGEKNFTGVYGKEFIWYDLNTIDQFIGQGMNMFRLNFLMERLTPNKLDAPLDPLYLGNLTQQIKHITDKGAYAMVQPHNYGRFHGEIITDTAGFKTWWKNVAAQYKDNELVVFDTNNEYHDMDQKLVFDLNQAAIDGVREAGAKKQYITPEGNSWSGAWTWVSSGNGASLVNLKDPENKLIYQMHQYLDTDGSGTHAECVSATIFSERLQAATKWLKDNKKQGVIGEFAGGNNAQCISALKDGLKHLGDNTDVWWGAIWWAAGPWWGDYMYSMEPTSGVAWTSILPQIKSYFV